MHGLVMHKLSSCRRCCWPGAGVCKKGPDDQLLEVICRGLGLNSSSEATANGYRGLFDETPGPLWIDEVRVETCSLGTLESHLPKYIVDR